MTQPDADDFEADKSPLQVLGSTLAILAYIRGVADRQHALALHADAEDLAALWAGIGLSLNTTLMAGMDLGEKGADDA